jgi:hypothetical protein
LVRYTIIRCPRSDCRNVWSKRVSRKIKSCPECHRRFTFLGSEHQPEITDVEVSGFDSMQRWLEKANCISKQTDSLEEILQKLPPS